ncbi:MAG: DUF6786 family protein [Chitinophagaceae bacterium]
MRKRGSAILIAGICIIFSCNFEKTAFEKDLAFLQKYDSLLVVLSRGNSQLILSPKYQAKVFTSTAGEGSSFGWINYKLFDAEPDPHMNAFGGENRIWLGPEGGAFSLFFPPKFVMNFGNWKIPPPFDTEPWELVAASDSMATIKKKMELVNYSGNQLSLTIDRKIKLLDKPGIEHSLGTRYGNDVDVVGYLTENSLTNSGQLAWTDSSGMPCIWILDMFPPSPNTTIIIPYKKDSAHPVNTNYFGDIPTDRVKYTGNTIFFKADGMLRKKLSVPPGAAKNVAGSYNADKKILTITLFDIDPNGRYLNQEWDEKKPAFSGDVVNAYNDGPLEDGRQLGPFYVLESVSPAAFLEPGQALTHRHSVFHFTGDEKALDPVCQQTLGVSLEQVKNAFR